MLMAARNLKGRLLLHVENRKFLFLIRLILCFRCSFVLWSWGLCVCFFESGFFLYPSLFVNLNRRFLGFSFEFFWFSRRAFCFCKIKLCDLNELVLKIMHIVDHYKAVLCISLFLFQVFRLVRFKLNSCILGLCGFWSLIWIFDITVFIRNPSG